MLENLILHFQKVKNYTPSNVNELLDYVQSLYIYGELSIVEYKKLFSELYELHAEKPSYYF